MIKWKDEFSVNVNSIDMQHKKLFEIGSRIDELLSLNDRADHYDEIMAILEELKDYTIYHFDFDEIYQFVIGWIADHILKSDMKYKQYLNGKGVY